MIRSYELALVAGIFLVLSGLMGMAAINTDGSGSEAWGMGCVALVIGLATCLASVVIYRRSRRRRK